MRKTSLAVFGNQFHYRKMLGAGLEIAGQARNDGWVRPPAMLP